MARFTVKRQGQPKPKQPRTSPWVVGSGRKIEPIATNKHPVTRMNTLWKAVRQQRKRLKERGLP